MKMINILIFCSFLCLNSFGQNQAAFKTNPFKDVQSVEMQSKVRVKFYPIWFIYGLRGEVGVSLPKGMNLNLGGASYYRSFYPLSSADGSYFPEIIYEKTDGYTLNISIEKSLKLNQFSVGGYYQYKTRTSEPYLLYDKTYEQRSIENNTFAAIARIRTPNKRWYAEGSFILGLTHRYIVDIKTTYSDIPQLRNEQKSEQKIYLPYFRPGIAIGFAF